MFISLLHISLHIPYAKSLKDKRQHLRSLKDRFGKIGQLAVAETGHQDRWQRAQLTFVGISNDQGFIDQHFQKILNFCAEQQGFELSDHNQENL